MSLLSDLAWEKIDSPDLSEAGLYRIAITLATHRGPPWDQKEARKIIHSVESTIRHYYEELPEDTAVIVHGFYLLTIDFRTHAERKAFMRKSRDLMMLAKLEYPG